MCTGAWRSGFDVSLVDEVGDGDGSGTATSGSGGGGSGFGDATLYFGNQRCTHDFLYEHELCGFVADGTLTRLWTAFSRDQVQRDKRQFGAMLVQVDANAQFVGSGKRL